MRGVRVPPWVPGEMGPRLSPCPARNPKVPIVDCCSGTFARDVDFGAGAWGGLETKALESLCSSSSSELSETCRLWSATNSPSSRSSSRPSSEPSILCHWMRSAARARLCRPLSRRCGRRLGNLGGGGRPGAVLSFPSVPLCVGVVGSASRDASGVILILPVLPAWLGVPIASGARLGVRPGTRGGGV